MAPFNCQVADLIQTDKDKYLLFAAPTQVLALLFILSYLDIK